MPMRSSLLLAAAAAVALLLSPLAASSSSVNYTPVLGGYDVVEYFHLRDAERDDEPGVLGFPTFSCRMRTYDRSGDGEATPVGVYEFWFANKDNAATFGDDPWKYAPRFGGFGVWGLAMQIGTEFPWTKEHMGPSGRPWDSWSVHNGSLYISDNPSTRAMFLQNIESTIEKAEKRWKEWWGDMNAGPFNVVCQGDPICYRNGQSFNGLEGTENREGCPDIDCTFSEVTPVTSPEMQPTMLEQNNKVVKNSSGDLAVPGVSKISESDSFLGGSDEPIFIPVSFVTNTTDLPSDQSSEEKPEHLVRPVLLGYDMVEYFNLKEGDEGVIGNQKHVCHLATYDKSADVPQFIGVYEFWFVNEENMNKFSKDPWKFAPKWGGFCSWGIARERPDQGWPWAKDFLGPPAQPWNAWRVYQDSLYFNYWPAIARQFFSQADRNIDLATERWTNWFGVLQAGPFNTHCTNAVCVDHPQNLHPPCPTGGICTGDIPEVRCFERNVTLTHSFESQEQGKLLGLEDSSVGKIGPWMVLQAIMNVIALSIYVAW